MTSIFIRAFVKNYKNTELQSVRVAYGEVSGIVGIITNVLLAIAKLIAGFLSASISITADGFNNLSDCLSSVVTMIGFKLSAKPADKDHPYGHARMEYIAGLIVSIIIIFLGLELVQSAIKKIVELFTTAPVLVEFKSSSIVSIVVLGVSMLVKLWLALFYNSSAKAINSTSLKAARTDSLNDVISTAVVLIGLVITKITGFNLDGFLGLAVAIFIIVSGIELIKETSGPLLGAKAPDDLEDSIIEIIRENKEILGYHDLTIHDYGGKKYFATVHLEMDSKNDLESCHYVIDNIERVAKNKLGIDLVVHLDPVAVDDIVTEEFRKKIMSVLKGISEDLTIHDLRVTHTTPPEISFDLAVPYDFYIDDEHLKSIVGQTVKTIWNEDSVLNLEIDHV